MAPARKGSALERWRVRLVFLATVSAALIELFRFAVLAKHEEEKHIAGVMRDSLDTPAVNSHIVKVVRDSLELPRKRHR